VGLRSWLPVALTVALLLPGCATKSAFMPLDDWITQTLIDVDSGVTGQTKFAYSSTRSENAGAAQATAGSVSLTVTGVFSYKLDAGAPAGFYVMLSGEVGGSDTRTVALKVDPRADVALAKAAPGRSATILECESGGLLERIFGDGRIHVLGTRQVPFVTRDLYGFQRRADLGR